MTDASSLADLAPDATEVAARVAYLQLVQFQELSALVADAPSLDTKQALGRLATTTREQHEHALRALGELGADTKRQLAVVADDLDEFATRVGGRDWEERLLTVHLAGGMMHDFTLELLELAGETAQLLEPAVADADTDGDMARILRDRCEAEATLGARLAMWGRRLTGDAVLAVRRAFGVADGASASERVEEQLEQLASRLMAQHSRRMNALGFAA